MLTWPILRSRIASIKKYYFMEEENYVNEYEGIVGGSKRE